MFNRLFNLTITRVALLVGALMAISLVALPVYNLAFAQATNTIEHAENDMGAVVTFTATDPEGAMVMWSLGGTDADKFMIDNGVLNFKESPDFEMPGDVEGTTPSTAAAEDNIYEVTVKATDETMNTGEEMVMVEVTNVDEPGMVTLSAVQPQSATEFTAMLSDPDGGVSDTKWQWAKSGSENGSYADIEDATSETYTPVDEDIGAYLRAMVTYEDTEGAGKTARMKSMYSVQGVRGSNSAPEFAEDQDPVEDGVQGEAEREVVENTAAGKTVGSPVTAEDEDGDNLTYTLEGTNAASFDINWATGQILTKGELDYDVVADRTYTVVVRATDPSEVPVDTGNTDGSDTVTVMIMVTNVNEAPDVTGDDPGMFEENTENLSVGTYTATDPEGDTLITWSLGGADMSKFSISDTDELDFKDSPDYEMPTDANKDNVYEVTVQASDGKLTGMKKVKVKVTNVDEPGVVTLSRTTPRIGFPVTATLTDPDGSISKLTWQWSDGNTDIGDATSDTYTPVGDNVGEPLTVTAMYFDGATAADSDTKWSAVVVSTAVAEGIRANKPPEFGDEDPDTDVIENDRATREVEENTEAVAADDSIDTDDSADNVGSAVMAVDPAPNADENLTYTLSGTDADKFRVRDNGQIEVGAGTELNYEMKRTYMVTVTAEDSFGEMSSIPVTIMVTDIDEMPAVSGDEELDYAENGRGRVARYTATDPERAMVMWSLGGTDAGKFMIDNGVLTFRESPDFEMAMGGGLNGTSNTYMVTVQATDETRHMGMKEVMVEVTNVDEPGMVTLSAVQPQSATAFTAMLSDPDDGVSDTKWQWAKSGSKNGSYADIKDATSETYTPVDEDIRSYLRATVTYEDTEGAGKTARMKSMYSVQRLRGSNSGPEFAEDQDPVEDGVQGEAEREVVENTAAGKTVGSPVTATDEDGDNLTYTLEGTDADRLRHQLGHGPDPDQGEAELRCSGGSDLHRCGPGHGPVRGARHNGGHRRQRHGDGDDHGHQRERGAGCNRR